MGNIASQTFILFLETTKVCTISEDHDITESLSNIALISTENEILEQVSIETP